MNKFQENLKVGDWIYLKDKYENLTAYCGMIVNKEYKFLGFEECNICPEYKTCKGSFIIEGRKGGNVKSICGVIRVNSSIFGVFEEFIKKEEFSV